MQSPLAPVVAYLDLRRFGALPRGGGTFDQPADLMDEVRYVADVVDEQERKRNEAEERKAKRR